MKMIIGGKEVDSSNKEVLNIVNPYTGAVIDTVPNASEKDVDKAVKNAQAGFKKWKAVPVYKKAELMLKFVDLVEENKKDLAKTLSLETGKPIGQAVGEIANIKIAFNAFVEKAKHLYSNVIPFGTEAGQDNTLQITMREPLGVIAAIIPFNFPCDLFDQKVAPALLAGNTVVVKPPHQNPLTLIKLVKLMHKAGVPTNAINVVTGEGAISGGALTGHPLVSAITFTGSTRVGIATYENASKNLTHVALELGGNDAFIVCEDADIDLAVEEMVWGRMYNNGQVCCSSKRFLVQNNVLEEFNKKAVKRLKKLKVGTPESNADITCLVTEQAAINVEKQIKNVIAQGGKLLLGGKRKNAQILPTIITNIPTTADVATDDEIFGPVVSIIPFDTVADAIKIANSSQFGLSGSVFTRDNSTAFNVVNQLECGGTVINGASFHRSFEMPFGGYKNSGVGTEGVMTTFDSVTKLKTITLKNILKEIK